MELTLQDTISSKKKLIGMYLPIQIAVYVPSTKDANVPVSEDELNKRVDSVRKYLADMFGGFSSEGITGGYISTFKELIKEDIVKVIAFSTKEAYEQNKQKLIVQISKWAKEWSQEAIGIEFENDLYYINQSESFKSGGKVEIKETSFLNGYKFSDYEDMINTLKRAKKEKYDLGDSTDTPNDFHKEILKAIKLSEDIKEEYQYSTRGDSVLVVEVKLYPDYDLDKAIESASSSKKLTNEQIDEIKEHYNDEFIYEKITQFIDMNRQDAEETLRDFIELNICKDEILFEGRSGGYLIFQESDFFDEIVSDLEDNYSYKNFDNEGNFDSTEYDSYDEFLQKCGVDIRDYIGIIHYYDFAFGVFEAYVKNLINGMEKTGFQYYLIGEIEYYIDDNFKIKAKKVKKTKVKKEEMVDEYALGGKVTESSVESFLTNKVNFSKGNIAVNYSGDNGFLFHYGTLIAKIKGKSLTINEKYFSKTTSALSNLIERLAKDKGMVVSKAVFFDNGGNIANWDEFKGGSDMVVNDSCVKLSVWLIKDIYPIEDWFILKSDNKLVIVFRKSLTDEEIENVREILSQFAECHYLLSFENLEKKDNGRSISIDLKYDNVSVGEFADGGGVGEHKEAYNVEQVKDILRKMYEDFAQEKGYATMSEFKKERKKTNNNLEESLDYNLKPSEKELSPFWIQYEKNKQKVKSEDKIIFKKERKILLDSNIDFSTISEDDIYKLKWGLDYSNAIFVSEQLEIAKRIKKFKGFTTEKLVKLFIEYPFDNKNFTTVIVTDVAYNDDFSLVYFELNEYLEDGIGISIEFDKNEYKKYNVKIGYSIKNTTNTIDKPYGTEDTKITFEVNEIDFDEFKNSYLKSIVKHFSNSEFADGGEVQFIEYKGNEIMFEPHFKEYFVGDEQFSSLEDAKKYIDDGSKLSQKTINAYRHGAMKDGGGVGNADYYEISVNNVLGTEYKQYEDVKKDYDERSKNGQDVAIYSNKNGMKRHLLRNNSWAVVDDENGKIVTMGYISKDSANFQLPIIMKEKGSTNFSVKKIHQEVNEVKYADGGGVGKINIYDTIIEKNTNSEGKENQIAKTARFVRDFDLEKDTIIKARFTEHSNYVKKIVFLDNKINEERWAKLWEIAREKTIWGYEKEFVFEVLRNSSDVIKFFPKWLQKVKSKYEGGYSPKTKEITDIVEEILREYEQVLPIAIKWEQIKDKIEVKRELSEEEKEQAKKQRLRDDIYNSMPKINHNELVKWLNEIEISLKPTEEDVFNREMKRYTNLINKFVKSKEVIREVMEDSFPFQNFTYYVFNRKTKTRELPKKPNERHGKTEYYYTEISLKNGWQELLTISVRQYVESLKWKLLKAIFKNFTNVVSPIDEISPIEIKVGVFGFESKYLIKFKTGASFKFSTRAISAGGFNIQVYHFRYITDFYDAINPDGTKGDWFEVAQMKYADGGSAMDLINKLKSKDRSVVQEALREIKKNNEPIQQVELKKINIPIDYKSAISDLIDYYGKKSEFKNTKYAKLTKEEAEYLYDVFKNYESLKNEEGEYLAKVKFAYDGSNFKETEEQDSKLESFLEGIDEKGFIYYDSYDSIIEAYQITIDFINSVRGRLETRKNVSMGLDLFPETSKIQEANPKYNDILSKKIVLKTLIFQYTKQKDSSIKEKLWDKIQLIKNEIKDMENHEYKDGGDVKSKSSILKKLHALNKHKHKSEELLKKYENMNSELKSKKGSSYEDILKGGKSDGMDEAELAKKHGVSVAQIKKQIEKGISIEKEHTDNLAIQMEIAKDHIEEFVDYYDRLEKMEKQAKIKNTIKTNKSLSNSQVKSIGNYLKKKGLDSSDFDVSNSGIVLIYKDLSDKVNKEISLFIKNSVI